MYHAILQQARASIEEKNSPLAFDLYFKLISIPSTPNTILGEAYFQIAKIGFLSGLDLTSLISMLNNALCMSEETDAIHTFIMDSFINPNHTIFKANYENSIKTLQIDAPVYEDLKIRFIPIDDTRVYLYNAHEKIIHPLPIQLVGYSDISMVIKDEDTIDLQKMLQSIHAYTKDIYIITHRPDVYLSYFQLSSLPNKKVLFFENIDTFKSYAKTSITQTPKIIFASETEKQEIQNCIPYDKQLLSICIPTYNRGKRAYDLVQKLLPLTSSYLFEIIISDNASDNDTVAYYEKIAQIQHPRLQYHKNETNLGFVGNFHTVLSLSNASFSMLLSDEDCLDLTQLHSLLCLLKNQVFFSALLNLQQLKINQIMPPLTDEFDPSYFFNLICYNYISGIVYNNQALKDFNILQKLKSIPQDNTLYTLYPHIVTNLLLANEYPILYVKNNFIRLGKTEPSSLPHQKFESGLPLFDYALHQNRAQEFIDFTSLLLFYFSKEKTISEMICLFETVAVKYLNLMNFSAFVYAQQEMKQLKLASTKELATVYLQAFDTCFESIIKTYNYSKTQVDYTAQKQNLLKNIYINFLASIENVEGISDLLGQYL